MSKVDAQRAMREAKFARQQASGPTRREAAAAAETTKTPAVSPAPAAKLARRAKPAPSEAAPVGELCGHKSMNGRACTRVLGHAEKSHRYG